VGKRTPLNAPEKVRINAPKYRSFTKFPQGPRLYKVPKNPLFAKGPGEPPPDFLDPRLHGSRTEWPIYWALARIFNNPPDPRKPPYVGGPPDWSYQKYEMGGRNLGGAVVDFVVSSAPGGVPIGLRIGTEFFHFAAAPGKQASDELQFALLSRGMNIVDINDFDFLQDPSGQAAVVRVKEALGLIRRPDPIASNTTRRNR
jgi:hypothetical protein